MTQRNTQPQTRRITPHDVSAALLWNALPLAAALVLVLVLITVQPGAGIGFA